MIDRSTNVRGALRARQHGFIINPFRFGGGGGGGTDPHFANVISLLHFDGSDGSTTITDQKSKTWTASGTAQLDTAQSKFGGSSLLVTGGNGKVISTTDAGDQFGTGDFTIEFWLRISSFAAVQIICDTRASGAAVAPALYLNGSSLRYFTNNADRIIGANLTSNTWYFIALSRVSGSTRLFVDGTQSGSTYADSNNYVNQVISYGDASYQNGNPISGWVDEARITKGVGRYSSTFTPPSAPFPNGP